MKQGLPIKLGFEGYSVVCGTTYLSLYKQIFVQKGFTFGTETKALTATLKLSTVTLLVNSGLYWLNLNAQSQMSFPLSIRITDLLI